MLIADKHSSLVYRVVSAEENILKPHNQGPVL